MNQLKSISYVNAASIPFAKVELDGNTLMIGANGSGKTTVLRSALYFYGVHEDSALGINIRKKKGFKEYYFNELNSFLAYRYHNNYGDVLVVAYRSGNSGVKFKFIMETTALDDNELFLVNRIARSPEELWKHLRFLNYEVSEVVSTLGEYRNILYGHASTAHKKYAFFDTKEDHNNFIHVLSNVFVNSKLDASSIKKTISNAIGGFEPIDLEQIERSISSFRGKYDDVTRFETNRGTVDDILRTLLQYENFENQTTQSLHQLISNKKVFLSDLERFANDKKVQELLLNRLNSDFEEKDRFVKSELKVLNEKIIILKNEIQKADEKLKYYQEKNIDQKLELFLAKERFIEDAQIVQKQYDALTNTQSTIKEKFSRLLENEKRSFEKQMHDIDTTILTSRHDIQDKIELLLTEESEQIEVLEAQADTKFSELKVFLDEANQKKERAYKEKIEVINRIFLKEELIETLERSQVDKRVYEEAINKLEKERAALVNINTLIESIEKEQQFSLENLKIKYESRLNTQEEQMERLNALLNVSKESFLGFVREVEHPKEALITSVLKESVLLSSQLDPSFTSESDSFFGFTIDTSSLESSDYSKESIEVKQESIEAKIRELKKQFKDGKSEMENLFRSRLNEQRRAYRQINEAMNILEIDLPRLKNSWMQGENSYQTLVQKAEQLKAEAVANSTTVYEQIFLEYQTQQGHFDAFKNNLKEAVRSIKQSSKTKKEQYTQGLNETLTTLESQKSLEQEQYAAQCFQIERDEVEALIRDEVDTQLLQEYRDKINAVKKKLDEISKIEKIVQEYQYDQKENFEPLEEKRSALEKNKEQYQDQKNAFKVLEAEYKKEKNRFQESIQALEERSKEIDADLRQMEKYFTVNSLYLESLQNLKTIEVEATQEKLQDILNRVSSLDQQAMKAVEEIRTKQDLLYRDFTPMNSLDLLLRLSSDKSEVLDVARNLKRFMDEGKIEQFKEEVSNLFSLTINQLTKQTEDLLEARQEVDSIVNKIRAMLRDLEGISVIDSIDLRTEASSNKILSKLEQLQLLNDENALSSEKNLFNFDQQHRSYNEAITIIKDLRQTLDRSNKKELILDDTYELEIRASENGNDTGWQVSLDEVGSNGTDVMIKTIVNIAMLAISLGFKAKSNRDNETYFHCILDEIGVLHPSYLKELIAFANNKQIRFLNGAPNRQLVSSFKRIYILSNKYQKTMLKPLLSKQ